MNKIVYTVSFEDEDNRVSAVKSNVKAAYEMVLHHNESAYWQAQPKRRGRKPNVNIPVGMKYGNVLKNLKSGNTVSIELFNNKKAIITPQHLEAK